MTTIQWIQKRMCIYPSFTDPDLKKRVDNFIRQEGTHFAEHQKFWDVMEAQNIQPMKFVNFFRRTAWDGVENKIRNTFKKNRTGDKLALSITVALEHFTAMLAESGIINSKEITVKMPDEMKELFMWHAAEEIEHKAIPFDVLKKVDDSYALRTSGMLIATFGLWFYLIIGTTMLTRNDEDIKRKDIPKYLYQFLTRFKNNFGGTLSAQYGQYFQKNFHPDQIDNYHLAEELLKNKSYA